MEKQWTDDISTLCGVDLCSVACLFFHDLLLVTARVSFGGLPVMFLVIFAKYRYHTCGARYMNDQGDL